MISICDERQKQSERKTYLSSCLTLGVQTLKARHPNMICASSAFWASGIAQLESKKYIGSFPFQPSRFSLIPILMSSCLTANKYSPTIIIIKQSISIVFNKPIIIKTEITYRVQTSIYRRLIFYTALHGMLVAAGETLRHSLFSLSWQAVVVL